MKRLTIALCLLMVVPSLARAEASFTLSGAPLQCSPANTKNHEFAPAGQLPRSAGDHLFFDAEALAGQADVELRYFLDGQLHLTEVLPLKSLQSPAKPADALNPRTVVELLAMRPAERKLLAAIGRAASERVRVEVWQDGSLQRSVSFAELEQESRTLLAAPFRPEVIKSQVAGQGKRDLPKIKIRALASADKTFVAEATCEETCQTQRDQCYATYCEGMDWCEQCELEYQDCLESCDPPPPPPPCEGPTVSYWATGWYYLGSNVYWWDQICYPDQIWYWYDGLWHVRVEHVYRRDVYRRTTQCDGSYSDELWGYEYLFFSCYDWTSSSCYDPWYPWNTCY